MMIEPTTARTDEPTMRRPSLLPGTALVGEYLESGFREPTFLARRADGQVVQLSHLLYLIADAADGVNDCDEIAARVTSDLGRRVSAANVIHLIERKLEPCGVATLGGSPPTNHVVAGRPTPLLALRFRVPIVPARVVAVMARIFRPLFAPPVIAGSIAGMVWFDWWLVHHGLGAGLVQIIRHPVLMLMVLGGLLASGIFHELGHATACRASGARPGTIGAGLYLVMPALYTDVTDSYRLGRAGRVRTDLGGVYHNVIVVLVCACAYTVSGFEPLLVLAMLVQLEIIQQFVPFVRLDGYWVISDLVGVPDLFGRIKPIVLSMLPGRRRDRRVTELKTMARIVVTAWVCITVPVLAVNIVLIGRAAPHLVAVATATAASQVRTIGSAVRAGRLAPAALGAVQLILVALPVIAGALTATWMSYRSGFAAGDWSARRPRPRHRRRRSLLRRRRSPLGNPSCRHPHSTVPSHSSNARNQGVHHRATSHA
jgi:putative peptide zinc metalloprotease protein